MRILFIHDVQQLPTRISRMFRTEGHEVTLARNGRETLAAFQQKPHPDLILADDHLPTMEGLDLLRAIPDLIGHRYVPIIMASNRADPDRLHRLLGQWEFEFISYPFKLDELRNRLTALQGLFVLSDHLATEQAQDEEEIAAVKFMLDKLLTTSRETLPASFSMETLQTKRINGDASAYRQTLPGLHFGLLCDAMGHGLMAGISTIPVVETFLTMVNRDLPLESIYKKINQRLLKLLPPGRFTCLTLFRLDALNGTLSILNAGMPEVLLLRRTGELRGFPSSNLPAGIRTSKLAISAQETRVAPGDRFLAVSDGLAEIFSREDLVQSFLATIPAAPSKIPDCATCHLRPTEDPEWRRYSCAICHKVLGAIGNQEQHDDVSWVCWEIPDSPVTMGPRPSGESGRDASLEPGLTFSLEVHPDRSPIQELLPQIVRLLAGQGVNRKELQTLTLLLSEALTNALDHGLLRLDSRLKEEGFEVYEAARTQRWAELKGGGCISLNFQLWHPLQDRQRIAVIQVQVADSGPGFDWKAWLRGPAQGPDRPSGRGLLLLRSLALRVTFNEAGNQISFEIECS